MRSVCTVHHDESRSVSRADGDVHVDTVSLAELVVDLQVTRLTNIERDGCRITLNRDLGHIILPFKTNLNVTKTVRFAIKQ